MSNNLEGLSNMSFDNLIDTHFTSIDDFFAALGYLCFEDILEDISDMKLKIDDFVYGQYCDVIDKIDSSFSESNDSYSTFENLKEDIDEIKKQINKFLKDNQFNFYITINYDGSINVFES